MNEHRAGTMKHKRIILQHYKGNWCDIFYYCKTCGTELVGDAKYFKEPALYMAELYEVAPSAAEEVFKEDLSSESSRTLQSNKNS